MKTHSKRVTLTNDYGFKNNGILTGSGDKGVIISHGFLNNKNQLQLRVITNNLVKQGYRVLRFDFTKLRLIKGGVIKVLINDLSKAIDYLSREVKELTLIGVSLGSLITLLSINYSSKVKKVAVITPIYNVKRTMENYRTKRKLVYVIVKTIVGNHLLNEFNKANPKMAIKNSKKKLLILTGDADKLITLDLARELYNDYCGGKKLVILRGAGHVLWHPEHFKVINEELIKLIE